MFQSFTFSIIIVSHNSVRFLPKCLASIVSQQSSYPFEIILVDNASEDTSVLFVQQNYPQVNIIHNKDNKGFAYANNQGIRHSKGKYVLLLNPDTILLESALERLVSYLDAANDVGAVGPKILNPDGTLQRTGVSFPSLWNVFVEIFFLDILFPKSKLFGRHKKLYKNPNQLYDVDYLQGSCLMIRKSILDEIGLLDESFFMFFEETDICYRIKKSGKRVVYCPEASVIHFGRSGMGYYDKMSIVQYHQSLLKFIYKHFSVRYRVLFRCAVFVRSLVRAILLSFAGLLIDSRRTEFYSRSQGYWKAAVLAIKSFDE